MVYFTVRPPVSSLNGWGLKTWFSSYFQAIEELFALMRLFSGHGHPNLTSEEKTAAAGFRKSTIMLYLNCLDGVSHWTTLIT
jgi:hypothetical protein